MDEPIFGLTPPPAPRPVIPLEPAAVPPPLPAAPPAIAAHAPAPVPPQANGPYSKPPVFFRTDEPQQTPGGAGFAVSAFVGVVILMIGLGVGFLVALRVGPNRAGAKAAPPAWKPLTPPAAVAPPVAPGGAPLVPAPAPAVRPPQAAPSPYPPTPLPAEREIDLQLKRLWQTGEDNKLDVPHDPRRRPCGTRACPCSRSTASSPARSRRR